MKLSLLTIVLCIISFTLHSQGTAINETGAIPHTSAVLDVQSDSKGVLIPRMTSAQRTGIASPATGLLVYDTNTASFWYRTPTAWTQLTDNFHGLRDADHDTQVQVEESPDEDIIRFDIGGIEAMALTRSTQGAVRLDFGTDHGLFIGQNAGLTSYAGFNTFIGYGAGQSNTTGARNVFLGYGAGQNGGSSVRNTFIGYHSGRVNNGAFNTFIGYQSGIANLSGYSNTFLGYDAGVQNTDGYRNTFVGFNAGHNNEITYENTFIGFGAGYSNEGNRNTFVGLNAGWANRTGLYNTVIGGDAAGNNLANRNMGNGNSIMGHEAGLSANGLAENVLVGFRAGYNMTSALRNVYIGALSGFSTQTAYANVAIGPGTLRTNMTGSTNVAVGDSALYSNTASGNVALGSKAGMDNTTGFANTFLGRLAGTNNITGTHNTFIGSGSGLFNTIGMGNVAIGAETANANSIGNRNVFVGQSAGFRNTSGNENVFLGPRSGEYNMEGISNIAIGLSALTRNSSGHHNIALGEFALGNAEGSHVAFNNNIAIGEGAGLNATGSSNIIIGNHSGVAIAGSSSILIGNDITPFGGQNTYLGAQTSASPFDPPVRATAIGYGATISQDHSIILGDVSQPQVRVGIGTQTPEAELHVDGGGSEILKLTSSGNAAFQVLANSDVIVHHELLVNTTTGKPGYEMSVNGSIACEEILVQNSQDWPDYVFATDYDLMDFQHLRAYLTENQHLPGIPSAAEVAVDGVMIGDMQKRLLQKVEEMTLYILELESRIASLEKK